MQILFLDSRIRIQISRKTVYFIHCQYQFQFFNSTKPEPLNSLNPANGHASLVMNLKKVQNLFLTLKGWAS